MNAENKKEAYLPVDSQKRIDRTENVLRALLFRPQDDKTRHSDAIDIHFSIMYRRCNVFFFTRCNTIIAVHKVHRESQHCRFSFSKLDCQSIFLSAVFHKCVYQHIFDYAFLLIFGLSNRASKAIIKINLAFLLASRFLSPSCFYFWQLGCFQIKIELETLDPEIAQTNCNVPHFGSGLKNLHYISKCFTIL